MLQIVKDCWIIKVDDINYYSGWIDDTYTKCWDGDGAWQFETRNSAYAILEKIKSIYPKAKVFHLITGINED